MIICKNLGINFTLIFFCFPETKGRGLYHPPDHPMQTKSLTSMNREEVAEIFDGPNALAGANAMKETGLDVHADKALSYGLEKEGTAVHISGN